MKIHKNIKIVSILLILTLFFFSFTINANAESSAYNLDLDEIVNDGTIEQYKEVADKLTVTSLKNVDRLKEFTSLRYLDIQKVRIEDASFLNTLDHKIELWFRGCAVNLSKLDISKFTEIKMYDYYILGGGEPAGITYGESANPEKLISKKYDNQITEIAKSIYKPGMTDREIVKATTEYVTRHLEYDFNLYYLEGDYDPEALDDNLETEEGRNIMAKIALSGKGVCRHYAYLEAIILNKLGIHAIYLSGRVDRDNGKLNEFHAWVGIPLDGKWYVSDPTWADGQALENSNPNYLSLALEDNAFNKQHKAWFSLATLSPNEKTSLSILDQIKKETKPEPTPTPSAKPTPTPKENKLDANLKVLSVAGKKIDLIDNVYEYKVSVGSDVTEANLIYAPVESTSIVTVTGNEVLKEGKNIIYIKVKSETGKTATYTITIEKANKILSKNSNIAELTIDGVNINFDKETTVYKVKVNKNVKELKFNIKLEDENATYKIIGNEDLRNNDQVTIKVKAEDESTTIYSIYIDKSQDNDFIMIIGVLIAFLAFIGIAVFITKRDNKNNKKQDDNKELDKQEEPTEEENKIEEPVVEEKIIEEPIETTSVEINNDIKEEPGKRKEIVIEMPELVKTTEDSNIELTNPEFEENKIELTNPEFEETNIDN